MSFVERRKFILGLVRSSRISTQTDLLDELLKHGFDVTQATVSRDIAAIGLIKVGGAYAAPDGRQSQKEVEESIRNMLLEVREAGPNLAVVRTRTGEAGALGVAIDRARWSFVTGTIAGDDTVFVAFADMSCQQQFIHTLREICPSAFVRVKQAG